MVVRLSFLLAVIVLALGCGNSEEASTQRAAPLTVEQQVAEIEKRTDMPDNIKAQTIASLRQQAAARQTVPQK
jgi:hypothetical protein